jgi:hypothetical protein
MKSISLNDVIESGGQAMNSPMICMVTLHGIGFEQPPQGNLPGYADDLHEHLHERLGKLLSDDPDRDHDHRPQESRLKESLPIYVQSSYPLDERFGKRSREEGMKRLGQWSGDGKTIDTNGASLTRDGASIAHVALVYSDLEGKDVQFIPSVVTVWMALSSLFHGRYDSIFGLVRRLWADLHPSKRPFGTARAYKKGASKSGAYKENSSGYVPGLSVRQEMMERKRMHKRRQPESANSLQAVFAQLQNDVAAYICYNEMREQIRGFALDAFLRLAARDDVTAIVINSHSNGTVIALDMLRSLPPAAAGKVKALITAGSPLRKYATLFTWGQHMDTLPPIPQWINFWDEHDPVADRLQPSFDWYPSKEPTPDQLTGLFQARDPKTGEKKQLLIEDIIPAVNNWENSSGGGLQAHNYWDNKKEFIPLLADCLNDVLEETNKEQ